jgi:hypothetical protein
MRIATVERIAKKISAMPDRDEAAAAARDLRERLEAAIVRSKALTGYFPTERSLNSETEIKDNGQLFLVLQYWNVQSCHYATSMTVVLEDGKLTAIARLLHLRDGLGAASQNIAVAGGGNETFEDVVSSWSVEDLAKTAVQRNLEQRVLMLTHLGFTVSRPTFKQLVKKALTASSLAF